MEDFRAIYRTILHRPELNELFTSYAPNKKVLTTANVADFLRKEQFELDADERRAVSLINRYEPIEEANPPFSPFKSSLKRGCRCVEIDCWDGPDGEPVVYHGHTLTSKITFQNVIDVVHKHAFEASDYPIILSLENHCSPPQQERMAAHMLDILRDTLCVSTLDDSMPSQLPSPEELKYKILIKNKKVGTLEDTLRRKGERCRGQTGETEETEGSDDDDDDATGHLLKKVPQKAPSATKKSKKEKGHKVKVAMLLSELVIYTASRKFANFEDSREKQKFYQNNSIGEVKGQKLIKKKAPDFVLHTVNFLTRIYPKGTRTDSSNYDPQEFWNVGCQLGVKLAIISGYQLPPSNLSKSNKADPVVKIEIHGVPGDMAKHQTSVIKNNALNPRWNETFTFNIQVPDLALIRFVVEDQMAITANDFLGQYTLPVLSMNKGYRHVPLVSKLGVSLKPASLFVYIWYFQQ
ncbi:hypothetical protein JD844_028783 [Phrynosoma platyrhinos]|uniref:Phosphoinositide phospholipase C n=1 Tax=Phrynosoma platyrhinos TaxID=52577 RepID=A0ABQ7SIB6_PHRPL|nr:hypothetical protein JD844_028783 [Phrynosoma platyrhinos]